VGVCNQITLLIPHYISSRLVTLLEVTDVRIQVPDIFYLAVSFKFLNFRFQICLLCATIGTCCEFELTVVGPDDSQIKRTTRTIVAHKYIVTS
jgi:hypothetical protein